MSWGRFSLVGNAIFNCGGDGFQIGPGAIQATGLIADNVFYMTPEYTLPSGLICGENALDFKAGHDILVRDNVMHGFFPNEPECAGTGSGGVAAVTHINALRIIFDGNTIYDVSSCPPIGQGKITRKGTKSNGQASNPTDIEWTKDNVCNKVSDDRIKNRLCPLSDPECRPGGKKARSFADVVRSQLQLPANGLPLASSRDFSQILSLAPHSPD